MELLVSLAALIVAFAAVVLYRHGDRRLAAGAIGVVLAGVLMAVSLPFNNARAANPINLTVTPAAPVGTPNRVPLEGQTYAQAKAALDAKGAAVGGVAVIPVPVAGLPPLSSSAASYLRDDATFSLSLHGEMDMFGNTSGELWLVATWPSGSSTDPVINTFIKFGTIDLADLTPGWPADFPVTLGPAILGITDTGNLLEPNSVIETDLLLDDGLATVDDEFDVQPNKLNMQATVGSGPLMDAADSIGGSGGVKLTGALGTSLSLIDEDEPSPTTVGIDLKAEFEIVTPAGFPEWVELSSPWTLEISADTGGAFFAQFTGGAIVKADGETEIEVTGSVAVEYADPDLTISMTLEVGEVPNLFGQDWLDLNGAEVHASINATTGDFEGGISASVTIGPALAALSIDLSVSGGPTPTTTATIDASISPATPGGEIRASEIVEAMGVGDGTLSPEASDAVLDVVLNELSLHIEVVSPPSPDPLEIVVSLFADATIEVNGAPIDARMLFRIAKSDGPIDFLVAASVDLPGLADLVPGIPFDWDLPDLAIVVSNAERTDNSADLDAPTFSYFAPLYCEQADIDAETCEFDLEVKLGVQISAMIEFPQDLIDQLESLNIYIDGPLKIEGLIPAFGGITLELRVTLPEISTSEDGIVESASISFFIRKVGTEFTAGIEGEMGFRIKRSDAAACDNEPEPDGDLDGGECYDVLNLSVTLQITSNIDGISIELLGTISEWDNAFGQPWLDIQTFTLKLGISIGAAGGVSLDLGMLGQLKFGVEPDTKDLTLAIKVSITPTPPWIVLKGFTLASYDGLGIRDVAGLLGLDSSGIPDVSLKNLWISYGLEPDVDLCIRQGFYLSAELHINAESSTGADPQCTPDPLLPAGSQELPTQACLDSDTCVAAIMIDVNTTPGPDFGFTGAAVISAFDLGPVHIGDTEILLKITTAEQRFRFSGSGYLEDPTGATDDRWAEGALTIDFSNNGGAVNLYVHGMVDIGDGYLLHAEVTANVAADFSLITSANGFLQFINSLEFDITVTITSEAWDEFEEDLEEAGETLVGWVDETEEALDDAYDTVVDYFSGEYCSVFTPAECNNLNSAVATRGDAPAYVAGRATAAYNDIVSTTCVGVICAYDDYVNPFGTYEGINCFTDDCNVPYANDVYDQIYAYWDLYGGSDYISLWGVHDVEAYAGSGSTWPSVVFNFLGACENNVLYGVGDLYGTVACGAGGSYGDDMIRAIVGPILEANFSTETGGYTLTIGTNGVDAVRTLDDALAPGDPVSVVSPMNRSIQGQSVNMAPFQPTCGSTTLMYSTGTITDYSIQFGHPGGPSFQSSATVGTDPNGFLLTTPAIQGSINTLTSSSAPGATCLSNLVAPYYGNTSVSHSGIAVEGTPYTINGTASDGANPPTVYPNANVTVDWGDGSTPETFNAASDGTWSRTHTYTDDPGPGSSIEYEIEVTAANAAEPRITNVVVKNADPVFTDMSYSPATPEVGDEVLVTFDFGDLGVLDTLTLDVDWGDGSPDSTLPLAAASTTATLPHSYLNALLITETSHDYTVTATLTDKDGGVGEFEGVVTVKPILPPESTIVLKNSNGSTYAPGSWTKWDVEVTISTNDTGHPPISTSYGADNIPCGQSWPLGDFCTNYLAPFSITTDGAHTFTVYSRDSRATEYPHFIPVKIDKTAAQVVIQPPVLPVGQGGYYRMGQFPVMAKVLANDISGINSLSCTVNGSSVPLSGVVGMGTTAVSADLEIEAQGNAVLVECEAINGAYITGAGPDSAATKTLKIDATPPVVQVTGVTNGGSYAQGSYTPGCSTTDALSGVATQATLSLTGGNGSGAGSVTATCAGGTDVAGNVAPAVSATFNVTCATSLTYRGTVNVKQGTIVYKPTVTVTLGINPTTCAVTSATLSSSANAPGSIQVVTATNWKPPVSSVANQWLFTMKTQNATTGGVYINSAYRALDGTSSLTVKLLNDRNQLYLKLTGMAPVGVGTTKVAIEAEATSLNRLVP